MAGWCGARTTSTRELLLDMPGGACHALPGRPVLPPLEPEAARFSEIGAICRLAPRLLCEQRRTSGAVGGAKSRLTPHIRLESCSPGSVLQPQTRTLDVIRSPAPSRARRLLGIARGSVNVNSRPTQELRMPPRSPRRTSTPKKLTLRDVPPSAAYPPISALRRLITELDQANSQPPVLSALDVQSYPQPLGACHVLNVGEIKDSSFVLSQSRSDGKGYISVAGQRRETAASAKSWPRTPSGRTKKLVNLHRWILLATRQQPPGRDYEASHVCGNSRCILAAHLRWQRRHTNNVLDRRFHSDTYTGTVRYSRLTWGVSESYK